VKGKIMEKNVGGHDRTVRWVLGSGLVVNGLLHKGWARRVSLGLGIAVLKSAWTQQCPVNHTLGVDTYADDSEAHLYPANA
jgi:hypothetical protein